MRRSSERILVSHAGTLPRPEAIAQLLQRGADGQAELDKTLPGAVGEIARKQVGPGANIVNDGEIPKRGPSPSNTQERMQGLEPPPFKRGEGPAARDVN